MKEESLHCPPCGGEYVEEVLSELKAIAEELALGALVRRIAKEVTK